MSVPAKRGREDFLLEQYRVLSEGITKHQSLRWEWQKFGMIGTFGFYAVVFSKDFTAAQFPMLKFALWLPVLLNILGLIVSYGIRQGAIQMADAVARIEREFDYEGWESSREKRRHKFGWRSLPMTRSTYAFWTIMIAVTVAAALFWK